MNTEMYQATCCSWAMKAVDDVRFVFSQFPNIKKRGYVQFNIPHCETAIFFDSRSLVSLGKKFILVHICRLIWRFHANAAHRHSMSDATVGAKSL